MIRLDHKGLKSLLTGLGYSWVDGRVNVVGIRAAEPDDRSNPQHAAITRTKNSPDRYNDTLAVVAPDGRVTVYPATVDPGRTWTQAPMNPQGCANLLNGQYKYEQGIHKGHKAFVQAGAVRVWRDKNRDFARNGRDIVDTGWFGINLHAGGLSERVGPFSAGCQVIWGGWGGAPWKSFYRSVSTAPNSPWFHYTLLDAADVARKLLPGENGAQTDPQRETALEQVLQGFCLLYDHYEAADLPDEEGVSFAALLNRTRKTGVLADRQVKKRPKAQSSDPREAMMEGFRLIYGALPEADIDASFHSRLNQLRHFGALAAD